jgi:predicted nucleic acid-binding Zn ribbon protein
MPIYKYQFEDGTHIEVQQKMSDDPHEVLPHPLKERQNGDLVYEPVKRVPSWNTEPVFKGKGFYKNDNS